MAPAAVPAARPARTEVPAFQISLRGGGSRNAAYRLDTEPLSTVTASGNHHGLVPADKVRKYGNAVCPPVVEVLVSALVEAVTGEDLPTAWD